MATESVSFTRMTCDRCKTTVTTDSDESALSKWAMLSLQFKDGRAFVLPSEVCNSAYRADWCDRCVDELREFATRVPVRG